MIHTHMLLASNVRIFDTKFIIGHSSTSLKSHKLHILTINCWNKPSGIGSANLLSKNSIFCSLYLISNVFSANLEVFPTNDRLEHQRHTDGT